MKKLILMIVLIALFATGCSDKNETVLPNEENREEQSNYEQSSNDAIIAPDFELESLDGTIKLSEMRDKYVMLNFWATWCGYCVVEMPDLQKLQDTYKDDLLIITVNVGEDKETVQKFMEENNLDLTVVLDVDSNVANTYGVRSFPTTIAVNKKGEAVKGYVGMLNYEQMEQLYGFFKEE